ncbi:MAG: hypothetical protein ABXS93_08200 [Sulfurimonas sp.]
MEIETAVFETVEAINYPVLIVEKKEEEWSFVYANSMLKRLSSIDEESQALSDDLSSVAEQLSLLSESSRPHCITMRSLIPCIPSTQAEALRDFLLSSLNLRSESFLKI